MLADANSGERPPWLEPYGGDPEWRQQMWGAPVALRGRYPEQLEPLKDKWWTDEATLETLAALATWRAELDETRQDPRDELAFQTQVNDYSQQLRQKGGGVTKTWTPGATPPEWAEKQPTRRYVPLSVESERGVGLSPWLLLVVPCANERPMLTRLLGLAKQLSTEQRTGRSRLLSVRPRERQPRDPRPHARGRRHISCTPCLIRFVVVSAQE